MEFTCRKLSADDIDMAMEMNKHFRADFISREHALNFLRNPHNWLFTAVSNQTIIGFAFGYELSRLNSGETVLYIHEVGVMDEYQRQGVGYQMMTTLKRACKEQQIPRYFLTAYQKNTGANALYQKLGGEFCPESRGNDVVYHFMTN